MAFLSDGDLGGSGQNADGNDEIYLVDATITDEPVQVTVSVGDHQPRPVISGDGEQIAFSSEGEYGDGGDNGDGSREIWLYDRAVGAAGTTQVTNSQEDSNTPSFSADGTLLAFRSRGDLTGDNPENAAEVFVYDTGADTTAQVSGSGGAGDSSNPLISPSGTRIAFVSEADLTGDNPDGGRDLFLVDTTADTTTQLLDTDDSGIEPFSFDEPGNLLAFMSTLDHTGGNAGGNDEVFLHEIDAGTTTQITAGGGESSYSPVLDAAAAAQLPGRPRQQRVLPRRGGALSRGPGRWRGRRRPPC